MEVERTRSITTGSGISVAVIDTGTAPVRDLRRNVLDGTDLTSTKGGDGKADQDGHGTGMASLIAGHGRGKSGIEGIAPEAKILPIRISKNGFDFQPSLVADGIAWAVANGADVINVSLSAGPAFEIIEAVAAAVDHNIVVVASVGNTSNDAVIGYPAAADGALAVGATGRNGSHSTISVKDAKVQICAPGVDIESAALSDTYRTATGTSDSAAIVSGAAALVRAKFPGLSAKEVVHRLTATTDDIGPPGRDDECGFGRLNIVKALTADVPPLEAATPTGGAVTTSSTPAAGSSSGGVAAPETRSGGGSGPLVFGVVFVALVAGGLGAFVAIRRRRGG